MDSISLLSDRVTNDRFKSSITRKTTGLSKKATQSHFSSRLCPITHSETGQGNDRDVQLGNTGACRLFSRLGSVGLPSVRTLGHALAAQRFTSYENVREWLDN